MKLRQYLVFWVGIVGISAVYAATGYPMSVVGSGHVVKETRALSPIQSINLQGSGEVYIEQSDENQLLIEAEDNILPLLMIDIQNDGVEIKQPLPFQTTRPLRFYFQIKHLHELAAQGAFQITSHNGFQTENLDIRLTGSNKMNFRLLGHKLRIQLTGDSHLTLSGHATFQVVTLTGHSILNARSLIVSDSDIQIQGDGQGFVNVKDNLRAQVFGYGRIDYKGNPKVTTNISGSGKVTQVR